MYSIPNKYEAVNYKDVATKLNTNLAYKILEIN